MRSGVKVRDRRKYLLEEGYPKDFAARVARAIAGAAQILVLSHLKNRRTFSWKESGSEADILDKLGASTIPTLALLGRRID
jgi:hypothetical protein